jgi:hypothetical protein
VLYDVLFIPDIDFFTDETPARDTILFQALYCRLSNHRAFLNIPTEFVNHLETKYGYNDFVMTVNQACETTIIDNAKNLRDMTLELIALRMVGTTIFVIAKLTSPLRALLTQRGFNQIKVLTPEEAVKKVKEIRDKIEEESDRVGVV